MTAQSERAIAPTVSAKGVVQPIQKSVCTCPPCARIWPLATAAAAVPSRKGVMVLAVLNTRPQSLLDQQALTLRQGTGGKKIPDAAPKICSTQHCIGDER